MGHYKKKRTIRYKKYKQYRYILGDRVLMVQGYEPQALNYMLNKGFNAEDIFCEVENKVPKIRYKYAGKFSNYIPDMYVPKRRLIVEVKSMATLGLLNNKKRGWSMTCAKAKACDKQGFKFVLLLMSGDGQRIRLPKRWAFMKKEEVVKYVEEFGGFKRTIGLGLFKE